MKIVMYTSHSCPYCVSAERLLTSRGIKNIDKIFVDNSSEALEEMINLTGRRTVPQIFINDNHVGGFDDLMAFDKQGNLQGLINNS